MTVSTSYSELTFTGNGSTTDFAVSWPFLDETLVVTLTVSGTTTTQTLGTHYTVTGGTDADGLPATGTVTMLSAPVSDSTLSITRLTPKTQASTWSETDAFPQKVVEAALDRTTLIDQELGVGQDEAATYATAASNSATAAASSASDAADSATAAATSETNAESYYNLTVANYVQPSSTVAFQHVLLDDISSSFNDSDVTFNLTLGAAAFTPESAAQLVIHLNGVYQEPGSAYTVSTSTITFTTTPATGDDCLILAMKTAYSAGDVSFTPAGNIEAVTVQAAIEELDQETDLAGLTHADGGFVVSDGTDWTIESGATARTSMGVGTADSPQFTGIEVGHATDTTLTRASAGDLNVEGNIIYRAGGTDVPVTDGGTGASTAAAGARALLDGLGATQGDILYHNGTNWVVLPIGTSGYFLKAQGAGANPTWASLPGGGDLLSTNNLSDLADAGTARTNLGVRTAIMDDIASSFNDSDTSFGLAVSASAFTPRDAYGLAVCYNGVIQIPGSAYTVSTSNITFTFTPASGDSCTIWAVST